MVSTSNALHCAAVSPSSRESAAGQANDLRREDADLRCLAKLRIENVDAKLLKSVRARDNFESVGALVEVSEDEASINGYERGSVELLAEHCQIQRSV